jgi:hypothetical protein
MTLNILSLTLQTLETFASLLVSTIFWPAIFIASTILFPIRYFVQTLLNLIHGNGTYTLAGGIDALFAYDKVANSSAIIHSILILKGEVDLVKIRQRYLDKVFQYLEEEPHSSKSSPWSMFSKSCTSSTAEPLYAQRLLKTLIGSKFGFPCWKDVSKDFDITRHVHIMNGLGPKDVITEDKLLRMVSGCMDEGVLFNNDHPQWEHLIVPNYRVENSSSPHFACILRVHHAYADGASFGILVDTVLSDSSLKFAIDPLKPFPGTNFWSTSYFNLKAFLFGPLAFLLTLKSAIEDKSSLIIEKRYSRRKVLDWSNPIDMNFLKELRRASGASVASILMTAFGGAVRTLHEKRPKELGPVPDELNVGSMALMLPYKSRQFQNHFTTFRIPCPVKELNRIKRLKETDGTCRKVSYSCEPIFNFFIMRFAGYLPRVVQDILADLAGTPVLFSNVPGPIEPYRIFGGEVVDAGAWLPMVKTYGKKVLFNILGICF